MAANTEPTERAQMETAQSTAHGGAPKVMAQLKAVGSRPCWGGKFSRERAAGVGIGTQIPFDIIGIWSTGCQQGTCHHVTPVFADQQSYLGSGQVILQINKA